MPRGLFILFFFCFVLTSLYPITSASTYTSLKGAEFFSQAAVSLSFSTYMGGSAEDSVRDVAIDSSGNIIITGGTASLNFPVTSGSLDTSFNGWHDVYVAKLDPSGSLLWATFLGGPNYDRAYAVEVDSQGFIYVAGRAGQGFPTTSSALQRSFAGDVVGSPTYGAQDGFISKLSPDGRSLVWSTYFGSDGRDFIRDLAVDSSGNSYIGVSDVTRNHPRVKAGAFQTTRRGPSDGVVAKINSSGSSVVWCSYFGGSADDGGTPSVRVDSAGNLYYLTHTTSSDAPVTANAFKRSLSGATDLMLARISSDGSWLVFSTYFGGSNTEFTETHGLALDQAGNPYIAFTTKSTNLPVTTGAFQTTYGGTGGSGTGSNTNYPGDAFVAKLSASGSQLLASTYLGGRYGEGAEGIMIDSSGQVCVSGATYSDNFPVTSGAIGPSLVGSADVFAVKLSGDLRQLRYSSYLGGHSQDYGRIAGIDSSGSFYIAGSTESMDWPLVNPVLGSYRGGKDGMVARLSQGQCQPVLTQTSQTFQATGGTGSVGVNAQSGCGWSATCSASWINVTAGSGTGSGTLTYSVTNNTGQTNRVGTISVAGQSFTVYQGVPFNDVPVNHLFYNEIERLSARGITLGCGGGNFCPNQVVTRDQMAGFIIRALGSFNPPAPAVQRYADVLPSNPFYAFIDQMAVRQITLGCGGVNYCPADPVLRGQMAAFIIRALHTPGYIPPAPSAQRFADVPPSNPFYAHIEEMAGRGITLGCGGGNFCPSQPVTRAQMAAFLVRALNL